jgi:hypothetical protein
VEQAGFEEWTAPEKIPGAAGIGSGFQLRIPTKASAGLDTIQSSAGSAQCRVSGQTSFISCAISLAAFMDG